jgi:ribosomal protein L37AE/L43A
MAEIKVKIVAKVSTGKAFRGSDDNWYNVNEPVIPYLAKFNKGDEVLVTYTAKGTARYVSKLAKATAQEAVSEPEQEQAAGNVCEVCGKELKDSRFKKCWACNKNAPKKERTSAAPSEDRTANIQRGNALNAAAAVAANQGFSDVDSAAQWTKELATQLLDWLRLE